MGAIYKNESFRVAVTPTVDIPSGTIIKNGDLVGVATSAIPANTVGYMQISGEYDVDVSSVTAAAGHPVSVAMKTPVGADVTAVFGYAINSIADTDTVARLLLDPYLDSGAATTHTHTANQISTFSDATLTKFTPSGSGTASDTIAASTATNPTDSDFDNFAASIVGKINAIIDLLKPAA